MESKYRCPLCGNSEKCNILEKGYYSHYRCEHYGVSFYLHTSIIDIPDEETKEKALELILEVLLETPLLRSDMDTEEWHFNYYPDQTDNSNANANCVNVAKMLKGYPVTIQEKSDRALLNLCRKYPNYDDLIYMFWSDRRMIYDHVSNNQGTAGLLRIMCDLGLLAEREKDYFAISAKGWQRIYELQTHKDEKKQAFIAMAFRKETKSIRKALKDAIEQSGYVARLIDEKEHNNQIVPEIFYEIERSKFVVVDVTFPNNGAYYEAGYAQALGKQVIMCCRKAEFDSEDKNNRPHFDVAQKSMIVWKNHGDLIERLKKRIEATVE